MNKKITPPKKLVTTSDIARISGISRSTVSAVLNGKRGVREKTRLKVLDCVRENNFGAGIISRALVGELSQVVAVLVPQIGNPFQMMYFRGLHDVLDKEDFHLMFHNVRAENRSDLGTLKNLSAYRPAGCIVLRGAEGLDAANVGELVRERIPTVCGAAFEGLETHVVGFDQRAAMKLGTDYVIAQGHRRLGLVAGAEFSQGSRERKMGFMESLIQHDIPLSESTVMDGGEMPEDGYRVALEMLKDPATRPTVVVCFNDMVAMGVYRAAHYLSLNIPGDLSVMGFDGIDFAESFGPPLTSVNIFPVEHGRQSAEVMLQALRGGHGRGSLTRMISSEVIERESVRRI